MSEAKPRRGLNLATRVTILALLALLAFSVPGLIIIVFVPVVGWYMWSDRERIAELEKKLAGQDKKPGRS